MRHRVVKHSFGRKTGPRLALLRGWLILWFNTNELKQLFQRLKNFAGTLKRRLLWKKGTEHCRRNLESKYPNKDTVNKIVDDISVRFKRATRRIYQNHKIGFSRRSS